ncbi:sugar ABC transporter ATP-binding protein [Microbacterium testaceum]|uniref:sugar ABC transporter ATP-binding protein n=1 Tax=Microbacterium testaceum TaxID=2033 RepID=UPI0012465F18|nr:sugar ABC transporter ATP-binding protein [Microbacterium testaceum]
MSKDRALPVLEARNLRKAYGATTALDGAQLGLAGGSVTALIGENGAGKSTLVRILSGMESPDEGELLLDGEPVTLESAAAARAAGIGTVFQELSLVPDLTVAENLELAGRPGKRWRRSHGEEEARRIAHEWGLEGIAVESEVASLSMRDRQLIEILVVVSRHPKVLILDEPTSSLLPEDTRWLARVMDRLTAAGTAILFISHHFEEIEEFCAVMTVQRNGRHISTVDRADFTRRVAIEQMIGRSLESNFPVRKPAPEDTEPVLTVTDLAPDGGRGISLRVRAGEIVGIAALEGQGQRALFEMIAGNRSARGGSIEFEGRPVHLRSPRAALAASSVKAHARRRIGGIAFVPPERKTQGLVLGMSIRKNVALPALPRFARAGILSDSRETTEVDALLRSVEVAPERRELNAATLSGGNQQKVVFARAIASRPRLLLLFDPTRGVDVGTKSELYRLIQRLADEGTAILMYSTEIPELTNLCHRVISMYAGSASGEVSGSEVSEEAVMASALSPAPEITARATAEER